MIGVPIECIVCHASENIAVRLVLGMAKHGRFCIRNRSAFGWRNDDAFLSRSISGRGMYGRKRASSIFSKAAVDYRHPL